MKLKIIYERVGKLVALLSKKVESQKDTDLPEEVKQYTEGKLYEAQYILGVIERIIFNDENN